MINLVAMSAPNSQSVTNKCHFPLEKKKKKKTGALEEMVGLGQDEPGTSYCTKKQKSHQTIGNSCKALRSHPKETVSGQRWGNLDIERISNCHGLRHINYI